jgi:hypothetical protein
VRRGPGAKTKITPELKSKKMIREYGKNREIKSRGDITSSECEIEF